MTTPLPDTGVLALIDDLQIRYIRALDEKSLTDWVATFCDAKQASYICTSADSVGAGLPVALMMDDCHARLEDRVTFINKVWAGTFQDYRTRHFVQRVLCSPRAENGLYEVRTNFHITYTSEESGESGDTHILASGLYEDSVLVADGTARFMSKKAITDNATMPRYVVYPL
jgi:3-phenylpropionate/cinnamic acid dioxygenase small subunit